MMHLQLSPGDFQDQLMVKGMKNSSALHCMKYSDMC